jgi:three-Cys-motif partner protein
MSTNKNFFLSPQAAAIYKHKLLKSYTPAWAGKVGSTSADNRLVVYDAYSGPGRYEDEKPGSPELLVDTAEAMAKLRSVHSVFSEKEQAYCDRLETMLASKEIDPATYEVRQGPVEDHVDNVLRETGDLPLLVFLDPYGLTIPFDRVVHVLTSRDKPGAPRYKQPKTELLMNFSYEAVRRISGVIRSDKEYAAKDAQIKALDEALGGRCFTTTTSAARTVPAVTIFRSIPPPVWNFGIVCLAIAHPFVLFVAICAVVAHASSVRPDRLGENCRNGPTTELSPNQRS